MRKDYRENLNGISAQLEMNDMKRSALLETCMLKQEAN